MWSIPPLIGRWKYLFYCILFFQIQELQYGRSSVRPWNGTLTGNIQEQVFGGSQMLAVGTYRGKDIDID